MVITFFRDRERYMAWCEEHPHGYVLRPRAGDLPAMLHRAECGTVRPRATQGSDPTRRMKVCALSRAAVERWARERNEPIVLCKNCDVT